MLGDILCNVWPHTLERFATFLGMFWRHSPEYNIPPISRVLRIPFPVLVFLFLSIANFLISKILDVFLLWQKEL